MSDATARCQARACYRSGARPRRLPLGGKATAMPRSRAARASKPHQAPPAGPSGAVSAGRSRPAVPAHRSWGERCARTCTAPAGARGARRARCHAFTPVVPGTRAWVTHARAASDCPPGPRAGREAAPSVDTGPRAVVTQGTGPPRRIACSPCKRRTKRGSRGGDRTGSRVRSSPCNTARTGPVRTAGPGRGCSDGASGRRRGARRTALSVTPEMGHRPEA